MDLKNNRITVGVLLDNPKSRAVLEKNFPTLLSHPLLGGARNLTLAQVLNVAKKKLPKERIDATLQELRNL